MQQSLVMLPTYPEMKWEIPLWLSPGGAAALPVCHAEGSWELLWIILLGLAVNHSCNSQPGAVRLAWLWHVYEDIDGQWFLDQLSSWVNIRQASQVTILNCNWWLCSILFLCALMKENSLLHHKVQRKRYFTFTLQKTYGWWYGGISPVISMMSKWALIRKNKKLLRGNHISALKTKNTTTYIYLIYWFSGPA